VRILDSLLVILALVIYILIVLLRSGTLLDWTLKHKLYDIKKIKVFVLDEADIMINVQGHKDQCIRLHKHLPPSSQNLFFSATFDDAVLNFANVIIPDPVMVRLKREEESLDNIQQFFCHCQNEEAKYNAIANIFGTISMGQSFIFVATKAAAAKLHERLKKDGFPVGLISGDLTVEERNSIINKFRDGMQRVLIATNVIARGIDVAQVTLVINYDLPIDHETSDIDYETYLHRIGRTGRFGKFGLAINFVDSTWTYAMIGRLEKYFGRKITQIDAMDIDSMEALNRD
jgi:ATP-dependent RNA helicase DDX19/DBP5